MPVARRYPLLVRGKESDGVRSHTMNGCVL
jgi:hypothetical protein